MQKKYLYIVFLCVIFLTIVATSQAQSIALGSSSVKLARVDDAQISTLQNLRPHSKTVVYLGASAAALQKDAVSLSTLQNWIKNGGVMVVYSDAATLFGFQLQAARVGTAQKGGQLYGRATVAVPFGSEPLLWNDTAVGTKSPTTFGDMTVFYQLQKGDSLLFSNPAAVPLLRVTDLADPQTKLFASAVASYGNGWVIFAPRQVETARAQGNQFWNNVLRTGDDPPLPVDISALTTTANSLTGTSPDYKPLLEQLQKRLDGKWQPASATSTTELMPDTFPVARTTARAMVKEIQAATSSGAQKRVNAIIDLWMTQADLQRATDDSPIAISAASKWLDDAALNAPKSTEVLFWKGVMAAESADDASLSSARRAKSLNTAATDWESAASATPLFSAVAASESTFTFGNPTSTMLRSWVTQARQSASALSKEPPDITLTGNGKNAIILRHAASDPTLRLAEPAVRKLASLSADFGWVVPDEQVLIFPNESAMTAYGAGFGPNDETSFGNYGGTLQNQLLMVSQPSEPVIIPGTPVRIITTGANRRIVIPGTESRVVQAGTATASIVGRMHANALISALDEDGGKIPVWMQLGIMALGGDATTGNKQAPTAELQQAGAENKLLSADRFNAGMLGNSTAGLSDAESLSLMTYFYDDFGAGSVMETIQRIASGETANEALTATTGMDESAFFKAWYNALSGSRADQRKPEARRTTVRRKKAPKITNHTAAGANITRF